MAAPSPLGRVKASLPPLRSGSALACFVHGFELLRLQVHIRPVQPEHLPL
ncbi:hypothetical protein [Streptomyces sp. LaBMicrA B280]